MQEKKSFFQQTGIYIVIAAVIFAVILLVGYKLFIGNKNNSSSNQQQAGYGGGGGFGGGNRGNFKPTTGTISSISGQILEVNVSGTTDKVDCSNVSRIMESENGTTTQLTFSDLKVGQTVNVMGTNSNGTIAARMIFIGTMPTRSNNNSGSDQNSQDNGLGDSSQN